MPIVGQEAEQDHTLHGYRVRLQCNAPDDLVRSRTILEYHGARPLPAGGQEEGRLTVIAIDAAELHVPRVAEEAACHESGLRILHHDSRVYLERGGSRARLDFEAGRVDISLRATSAESSIDLYLLLTFVVLLLLQRRALFAVHAAALCRTPESPGVLIVAESDSGKSTMTMNLIHQGWHFLSDDSVMLRLCHDDDDARRVEALPLRRDFALDPDAAELFPDLPRFAEPLFTDRSKWRVSIDEMFPGQQISQCVPDCLVFPTVTGRSESEVVPLKPREALLHLMNQSSFLAATPELAREHLTVLRTLVGQSRAYRLRAGEDIKHDGARLSALMAEL